MEKIVFKKIPISGLISVLKVLFTDGAIYVDIIGVPGEEQDTISVMVREEYLEEFTENEEEEKIDFNELI